MARGTEGGTGDPAGNGAAVADLTYSAAGQELDTIIEEFEAGVIDVDRLVERLERATEIVDELDRRLRRTRMQVEELVPRLERIGRPDASGTVPDEDDGERGVIIEEIYEEETEVDVEFGDEDEDEGRPPGLF
jgi:exodeoxyribonuclease VII small subunit